MELEIYRALLKVNVPPEDAQAVADSIVKEIDKRYSLHKEQLFTKADGAELKAEIIKWCMVSIFGAVGLFAGIVKVWN